MGYCVKKGKGKERQRMKNRYENKKVTGVKRKAALFLGIWMLFVLCCGGCGKTKSATPGHLAAKNSVVVVSEYVSLDGVEAGLAYGSGFFIGKDGEDPQYLVTNHHVIADYLYFGAGQNSIFTDENGIQYALKSYLRVYFDSSDYVEAYVVGYNEKADVAVLRIASPTNKRSALRLCSPTEDMVGSTVYAIGYPGIADNPAVDSVTKWGLDDITFTSGVISRFTTTSGTGVKNIQVDLSIKHGNSGGPVVNGNGAAVGISTWGYTNTDAEEAVYAVNIDEVMTIINLYSVPYTIESESGVNMTVIIAVAAGVVVLLIVIVIIAVLTKKKNGVPAAPAAAPVSETRAVQTTPAANSMSGSSAASGDDSGYRLQGVAGALEGRRFMIRKSVPLTIGRNADGCNVVFPASTAGVSGKHCQVWFDHGCIWIKDLGSRHGTFLSAGTKLTVGQAIQIKPGEQICMGSESEMLVLAQKGGN